MCTDLPVHRDRYNLIVINWGSDIAVGCVFRIDLCFATKKPDVTTRAGVGDPRSEAKQQLTSVLVSLYRSASLDIKYYFSVCVSLLLPSSSLLR
jgi:hypothetical protein